MKKSEYIIHLEEMVTILKGHLATQEKTISLFEDRIEGHKERILELERALEGQKGKKR